MTPTEAKLIVAGAVVILAIALWLFLPMIWRRRQVWVDRVAEKEGVVLPLEIEAGLQLTFPMPTAPDPEDWLAEDPSTWDWPTTPPSGPLPVDHSPPRPWSTTAGRHVEVYV